MRYLLGASFAFSVMTVLVKFAGATLPSPMMVLARGIVTLVLSYALLRRAGIPVWGVDRPRLVLRGVLGFIGLYSFYYAVTALPLAEVTTLHYINPIITALLAALLLGERIGWPVVVALGASAAGTLLVTQPSFLFAGGLRLDPVGVGFALLAATASAGAYVTVRRLTRTDDPLVIVFYFPVVAVPATIPFLINTWVWPNPREWLLLLGIGLTTQVAQVWLTRGLKLVPAGRGMTLGYTQIVFASTWGVLFFDQLPSWWTAAGCGLVFAGALLIALTRVRA